jgi:hypothetical protein
VLFRSDVLIGIGVTVPGRLGERLPRPGQFRLEFLDAIAEIVHRLLWHACSPSGSGPSTLAPAREGVNGHDSRRPDPGTDQVSAGEWTE